MKAVIILAVIVIIGGLGWYFSAPTSEAPVTTDESSEMEEMNMDDMDMESTEDETSAEVSADAAIEIDADAPVEVIELDSFNFGYSQDEIRVAEGTVVTINLTSSDGFHDWVVDEFNAATGKIREGETTSVTFVADAAGTYEYYCSVGAHRANGMVGTLIVE